MSGQCSVVWQPFPSPLAPPTIARLSDIYRAGNGGVCGVVVGESGALAREQSLVSVLQRPPHMRSIDVRDGRFAGARHRPYTKQQQVVVFRW
jgi:hypothetical protein